MFSASVHCHRVPTYETAERLFNTIKPVITRTRQAWATDERPLYDGAARAQNKRFRLRKNSTLQGKCYDVILYQTVIARYYEPTINSDGRKRREILYNAYNSPTTHAFMLHVLNHSWRHQELATTGSTVMVPTAPSRSSHRFWDGDTTFTLRRVLVETAPGTNDFRIDTAQSFHVPFYTHASSKEDKAKRKALRQRLEVLMDLITMRLPQMEADAEVSYRYSRPFYSAFSIKHLLWSMRGLTDLEVPLDDAMTTEALESLMHIAQQFYNKLASVRARREHGYGAFSNKNNTLENPVTEADIRKVVLRQLLQASGAMQRTDKKLLPMWADPSAWPNKGVHCE